VAQDFQELALLEEQTPQDVSAKERIYEQLRNEDDRVKDLMAACNLWTAAFFMPLKPASSSADEVPTTSTIRACQALPTAANAAQIEAVQALAQEHSSFHWPVEFPDVFAKGGFDVALGNPPWEQLQPEEIKFFNAIGHTEIATLPGATRKAAIDRLKDDQPKAWELWRSEVASIEAEAKFIRASTRFSLTAVGKINTYSVFAELNTRLIKRTGRVGCIVQSDIATTETNKQFFAWLMDHRSLVSLFDFVNTEGIFPGIHRTHPHFCLLTVSGREGGQRADFCFWNTNVGMLNENSRHFELSDRDIEVLNPNTRTCPIFRSRRDAEITRGMYNRVPVLVNESKGDAGNPWSVSFRQGLFNMTSDSRLFRTRARLEDEGFSLDGNMFRRGSESYRPLYEAKMLHQFDHRWATYDADGDTRDMTDAEKTDPSNFAMPRYWVLRHDVDDRLEGKSDRGWLLGFRDITNTTNERTAIFSFLPSVGVGHTAPLVFSALSSQQPACLQANLCSFSFDYAARQKIGGTHLSYGYLNQLPVIGPATYVETCAWNNAIALARWIERRVLELTYTAWDMQPFARDLGYDGPPFRWDPERRFEIRSELDAAFFHLYGINRDDVDYIIETFPIVRRKDEATYGEYRTKRVILEIYDAIANAMATGVPFHGVADASQSMSTIAVSG
jgi:hypothetical protein